MSGQCTERAISVSYFLRIPNVGDRVNPLVIGVVSGRPVKHCVSPSQPHLLAIGSVMACANGMSHVWGTGVMHPDLGMGSVPASQIYALRGQLSYSAMRQGGIAVGDVPLGDPGYLAPAILGISRAPAAKCRVGLASHYVDRYNPILRNMLKWPELADLNVHDSPEVFLRRMAECETVVSSSLHGLVFAEALGIPNLWIKASDDIAGGDFKFRDWFSTTRHPQTTHHLLAANDTAENLAARADCHESTIDVGALREAFPHEALPAADFDGGQRTLPIERCRTNPVPVFLISFNRGSMLREAIAAIRRLSTPTDIIVHDNGSTDPRTIATLDDLQRTGITVYRYPAISDADALDQVDESVRRYFAAWSEPSRYVVSDCDVDMSIADPDTLAVYDELLNKFRQVECVGPMLRIRDIPRDYPLFNRVMNRHIEQFWRHAPTMTETSRGEAAVLPTVIDTTFALHRAGEPFRRLKSALRVYEPFEAKHLDWYHTGSNAEGCHEYACSSSPAIAHWNNTVERAKFQDAVLEHSKFHVVERGSQGRLEIHELRLNDREGKVRPQELMPAVAVPGFATATQLQKEERISRTEALRAAKASDVARWEQVVSHNADWGARSQALARLIEPEEAVFEFGAGRSVVPEALPRGCRYTPSDIAPLTEGVLFYDLNAPSLDPIVGHDVAIFSGVLEYLHDLPRAARFLAENFTAVACSYAVKIEGTSEEMRRRRYSGWFTDFTEAELTAIFSAAGFTVTKRDHWESQVLFRFDLRCRDGRPGTAGSRRRLWRFRLFTNSDLAGVPSLVRRLLGLGS